MENKIIEAGEIPENEKVYLKKDRFGWRVVHPIKKHEEVSLTWNNFIREINWFNFVIGSWGNLGIMLFILLLLLSFLLAYHEVSSQLVHCVGNQTIKEEARHILSNISFGV